MIIPVFAKSLYFYVVFFGGGVVLLKLKIGNISKISFQFFIMKYILSQ